MQQLETKKCTKCRQEMPLSGFYRHYKMADGTLSKCKTCTKRDVRENRLKRQDYYREYERSRASLPHRVAAREQYAKTPEGRAACNSAKRAYLDRNPVKRAAHIAVWNAIRDGRVSRQPCEVCGEQKAHAHHDDYSKPLDVRWLCTTHHSEWHKHNEPICPDQGASDAT